MRENQGEIDESVAKEPTSQRSSPSPFERELVKNELCSAQGSPTSLLSVHSTILQRDSPQQFLLRNQFMQRIIDKQLVQNLSEFYDDIANIKTEPPDSDFLALTSTKQDNTKINEIEWQKRQIVENETTVYRCQQCSEIFQKFSDYKFHRTQHSIEKRTCKICHHLCQGVTKLKEHVNMHTGQKPFKCDKCSKGFMSAHTLKSHMECHSSEFKFECYKCGKTFKTKRCLRGHMDTHAEKVKDITCKVCGEQFLIVSKYRQHHLKHSGEPPLPEPKCHLCNKVFKYDTHLRAHIKIHSELKFPCQYCNKIFPNMTKLRKHVNRSHVVNECEFCKKVFYDKAEFTKHKRAEHLEEKPTKCEFCKKEFEKPRNLQEHIRVQHTNDGLDNKCNICEKTFINRFLLHNHIKTHDKCFKCTNCDMTFASRYNLQLHSVTHTNERNYKCSICSKSYTSKVSLKNHTSVHCDERPYVCNQCGKTFKNNRRLYVHKFSHQTELKFECFTCGKKFKTKQYLKAHLYKHDRVQPFSCPKCPKRFKHKKTLDRHIKKTHAKKVNSKSLDVKGMLQSDDSSETNTDPMEEIQDDRAGVFSSPTNIESEESDELPASYFVRVKIDSSDD
ncbi:zinc finger protein 431-like [Euwallacea similis]|uniref:zinc finger protein 431-like n=1 Tax=Euwallacea similis TaxID=1736056 RepID=UPI00344CD090